MLNRWLAERAANGGPSVSLAEYADLPTNLSAPLTVCVFKTATAREIHVPDHITTIANGIRVFAVDGKVFTIDAIGDVDRLSGQVDGLLAQG